MRDAETRKRIKEKIRREMGEDIQKLLDDPATLEILLNPDGSLWIERVSSEMERFGSMPPSTAEALICSVASYLDAHVNSSSPILECEFPLDGSRFEGLLPPVVTGPTFSLRKHTVKQVSLAGYVEDGILTVKQQAHLEEAVIARKNFLIVGGTGSGKTTLANALIRSVSDLCPAHRLVVIEDTREIRCASENVVMLRTTPEVSQTLLLRATLRLRPDRIIVGEVRGREALDLLKSWNTGHNGGISTIHANGGLAAMARLEQLLAEASDRPMQSLIAEAIDIVVVISRTSRGRKVTEIGEVTGYEDGKYYMNFLE